MLSDRQTVNATLQTRLRKAKSQPDRAVPQASPSQRPLLTQASQVAHRAQLWCPTLHYHKIAGKTQLTRTERRLNPLSLYDSPLRVIMPRYRGTTRQPRVGHRRGRGAGHCGRASRRWGSRKSRPLSLGKYRGGACALRLRPLPGDQRDFGARGWRDSGTRR